MAVFLVNIVGKIKKLLTKDRKTKDITQEKFFTKDFFRNEPYLIGVYTYGVPKVLHWGESSNLHIGKFCSIADEVTIFLGGNHRTDWITTYPFNVLNNEFPEAKDISGHPATKGNVIIGNDVWIGYKATIMSGVTIGDGAVIGACSVVTKDVKPYEIVAGNPAKVIRKRFSDEIIIQLLKIAWWNWPIEKIKAEIEFLCNNNIEKFIERNYKDS